MKTHSNEKTKYNYNNNNNNETQIDRRNLESIHRIEHNIELKYGDTQTQFQMYINTFAMRQRSSHKI